MMKVVVKNFWLKAVALFLAIVVWFYVASELNKGTPEEKAFFGLILPNRVEAKEVPIKVTLIGRPLSKYRVLNDRLSVKPSSCLIMAPKNLLQNIGYVATEEIDISDITRSIVRQARIRPAGPGIILEKDFFVTVMIPIEKIEEAEARR